MTHDSVNHRRRSIRLKEYDYAQAGAYFVTICTRNRESLFGGIADSTAVLNILGDIAVDEWLRSAAVRHNVSLDAFVVMPNHMHGIIIIDQEPAVRRGDPAGRPYTSRPAHGPAAGSIGAIVGQFKAATSKRINVIRRTPGVSVWQRNYYEHVIRDEGDLNRIRQYITDDPASWDTDEDNPNVTRAGHLPGRL